VEVKLTFFGNYLYFLLMQNREVILIKADFDLLDTWRDSWNKINRPKQFTVPQIPNYPLAQIYPGRDGLP